MNTDILIIDNDKYVPPFYEIQMTRRRSYFESIRGGRKSNWRRKLGNKPSAYEELNVFSPLSSFEKLEYVLYSPPNINFGPNTWYTTWGS